jgi:mannose-1-phosphate guanylyltransferase/mannose-6-phosphate isomerase
VTSNLIVPVIICGGSGTRLWPLSRDSAPKQFAPLTGGMSTFQQTVRRVSDQTLFAAPIVVTNSEFRFTVADQLHACGVKADILLEPAARDSGPAIAVATEFASRRNPRALILVLAADHLVRDGDGFRVACRMATDVANAGWIVTFGITPTGPATNFGYIRPGAAIANSTTHVADAFIEKPNAEAAARHVAAGYLWNSGNFLFRADAMLGELKRLEPEMHAVAHHAVQSLVADLDFQRLPERIFEQAPKKSIDYAVMERTRRAAVLPVNFGWSDIGTWATLWHELPHDGNGNAVEGPAVLLDTRKSLIHSDETILTTVIGAEDLVVVATSDAVLVVPKAKAEAVKDLVAMLKTRNRREATTHRRVHRPWGYYQGVDAGARYQVKRIMVKPGGKLSLQKHFHRAEHWVVVRGTAEVECNKETRIVHENESFYVPIGSLHRLTNPGKIPLELIEVQVGSYLGEDDIVRVPDVYGRS